MRTVTVTKDDFLTRVRENRDNHRAVFEEALEGYRQRRMLELVHRVRDLKRGGVINQYIGLPEPEDHTDDYDRILTMVEMSINDTVELSENEFAMYVMDQWQWKQSFTNSTDRYVR